ncbi:MAG TPA: terminase family protein [Allosphingosinicella sp.]|nr:terminase family protein [Allosphingosinicella sp.]
MKPGKQSLEALLALPEEEAARIVRELDAAAASRFHADWPAWVREGQEPPPGEDWRVWVMLTGRGFGKTRAGAEWISALARAHPGASFALVAASFGEARRLMIEGRSGLLAVARPGEEADGLLWEPSRRRLEFASGAEAFVYSGAEADSLRGPEHHYAWCDELAKWPRAQKGWDNLMLGLRLGENPRALVTTTPRPIAALRAIIGEGGTVRTGGATRDNPHLAEIFAADMERRIGGTRLGRQELDGELIADVERALWPRELIEKCRVKGDSRFSQGGGEDGDSRFSDGGGEGGDSHFSHDCGETGRSAGESDCPPPGESDCPRLRESDCPLVRVVIGVDPPAGEGGDACGIVACGLAGDGIGYVLADHSASGLSPDGWARKVAAAAAAHRAHRVVAEANNGGKMVETVLRGACVSLPVKLVHAAEGKAARAEPVAALFESGRAKFAGAFPELEDELAGLQLGGGYQGPGRSPDRADDEQARHAPRAWLRIAGGNSHLLMVWALTELMLGPELAEPRILVL